MLRSSFWPLSGVPDLLATPVNVADVNTIIDVEAILDKSEDQMNTVIVPGASQVSPATAYMTNGGPAFPEVSAAFGWNHILDRKHLVQ